MVISSPSGKHRAEAAFDHGLHARVLKRGPLRDLYTPNLAIGRGHTLLGLQHGEGHRRRAPLGGPDQAGVVLTASPTATSQLGDGAEA